MRRAFGILLARTDGMPIALGGPLYGSYLQRWGIDAAERINAARENAHRYLQQRAAPARNPRPR